MNMAFGRLHPFVTASYLIGIIFITMLNLNPYMVLISLLFSLVYSCLVRGRLLGKYSFGMLLSMLVLAVVILPLFSHNGVTPLFYVNDLAVTKETIVFDLVMTGMLLAMLMWFQVWNEWMDSERFLYLFARVSPTLALLFSMVLRFIPMLLGRFSEIRDIQRGMGYTKEMVSFGDKCRMFIKEISILVSWSLENAIDTSMSMEGRGYGMGKRRSYHLFRWRSMDWIVLGLSVVVLFVLGSFMAMGVFRTYYFPAIIVKPMDTNAMIGLGSYILLLLLPLLIEGKERVCYR